MRSHTRLLFILGLTAILPGCGDDDERPVVERQRPATEAAMLDTLEVNYRLQQEDFYAELLADDFRFYPDPISQERENLPEFWDRATDSTQTAKLFVAEELKGVKINLTFNSVPQPVSGKPHWTYIDVGDTFIEVELGPTEEFVEGVTILVDGQVQRFFFRKGRTEADTLAVSPTAENIYIVEWWDRGAPVSRQAGPGSRPLSVNSTWTSIKTLFN
jgi:hypothetical protein